VTGWTIIRFLHLAAVAFFVGGQLMLVAAIAPAVRLVSLGIVYLGVQLAHG
jgi:hypothetical protein